MMRGFAAILALVSCGAPNIQWAPIIHPCDQPFEPFLAEGQGALDLLEMELDSVLVNNTANSTIVWPLHPSLDGQLALTVGDGPLWMKAMNLSPIEGCPSGQTLVYALKAELKSPYDEQPQLGELHVVASPEAPHDYDAYAQFHWDIDRAPPELLSAANEHRGDNWGYSERLELRIRLQPGKQNADLSLLGYEDKAHGYGVTAWGFFGDVLEVRWQL